MQLNIIILTYNCLDKIQQCLNSIYKHTYHNFKIFIIENNSNDGTREYLQKLIKTKNNLYLSLQKENLGIIKGRNEGFNFYQSINNDKDNYIMFLDADQYVKENWLNSYLKMIEYYDIIGIEAWSMRSSDFYPYKKTQKGEIYNYVGGGSLMLKADLFEELGKFDEDYDFMYFEDSSLCFLANKKGYKIGWNTEPVIIHNHNGPLLNKKNKHYFVKNWQTFRNKWKDYKPPLLIME